MCRVVPNESNLILHHRQNKTIAAQQSSWEWEPLTGGVIGEATGVRPALRAGASEAAIRKAEKIGRQRSTGAGAAEQENTVKFIEYTAQ